MLLVRYGDDCLAGVEQRAAAERVWTERRERFRQFTLERPPEKARLSAWGRFAAARRQRRGQGQPERVDVLGLPHSCSQTRTGKCTVRRQKLPEVKAALRRRLHAPLPPGGWRGRGRRGQ